MLKSNLPFARPPIARPCRLPAGRRIFRAGAWGGDKVDDVATRIRPDSQGKSLLVIELKSANALGFPHRRCSPMPIPVGVVLRKKRAEAVRRGHDRTDHFDIENSHARVEHL
jgi:hypothetical protein